MIESKTYCDICKKDITLLEDLNTKFEIEYTTSIHVLGKTPIKKFKKNDLCKKCFDTLNNTILSVIENLQQSDIDNQNSNKDI